MASRLKVVREPAATDLAPPPALPEFTPAPTRKRNAGWTADRQRKFITHLALSSQVGEACALVGLSSSSAYRLRNKAGADEFARAWDAAYSLSPTRLAAIVADRAINGRVERFYRNGELVMERRIPSDHLLTWLLSRLDPVRFGSPAAKAHALATGDPREAARNAMPALLDSLADVPLEECECDSGDHIDHRLGEMSDGRIDTSDDVGG